MNVIIVVFPDPAAGRALFLTQLAWRILAARLERGVR